MVAHTRLPSVGFLSWSQFLAVSLQVTRVINLVVGCHYFLPGLQLPLQPLRGLLPISLLGEQRHDGCELFAEDCYPTASWLRLNPGPTAQESSTLTTQIPSHVKSTEEKVIFSTETTSKRFLQHFFYTVCWVIGTAASLLNLFHLYSNVLFWNK